MKTSQNFQPLAAIFLLFTAIFLAPNPARAEINVGTSIEWLTIRSTVVAIGLIDFIKTAGQSHGDPVDEWTLTVTKVLKGNKDEKITFFVVRPREIAKPEEMFDRTSEFLVFLVAARGEGIESSMFGKLMPSSDRAPLSVFDLEKPAKDLFSLSGNKVEGREEIIKAVSEVIATHNDYLHTFSPKVKRNYLKMQPDTDAYKALYKGSSVYLLVPSFMAKESKDNLY